VKGGELPRIVTEIPGSRSRELARRLERVECPEVTCLAGGTPFFSHGFGSNVYDVDGNRYVDLLAGFGAGSLGYCEPELVEAAAEAASNLSYGMGDLYPAEIKLQLLEALSRVLPGELGHAILSGSGSEAVESAIKTCLVATGRPGLLAFEGAYHGLGLGALDATHGALFREPFQTRLAERTRFVPFGDAEAARRAVREGDVGAILFEPIQGRGGIRIPPEGFLRDLRSIADEAGILLVADEIWTGLGRAGHWLACEAEGVLPDVVALGKGLGGGLPISACVGRREVMGKWPVSRGEATHTSTHLGYPVGCAVALRVLEILERDGWVDRTRKRGERWIGVLREALVPSGRVSSVRGRGLLIGIEVETASTASRLVREALQSGWILIGEGEEGRVLTLSPPLNIPDRLLSGAARQLVELLSS
jgi:4-aminobutyrate aminotransferase/(S)-3-amino-2-methylpropionate transaminase